MASKGINKVILIGNLGHDPEIRYMSNGNTVTNITLATSDIWKDKNTGKNKEKTEWHKIVLFGKLAEIAAEYLHKGSQIYIEGSLQTRKWKDQNGNERYTTEIVVNMNGTMQMLGTKNWNKEKNKKIKKNKIKNKNKKNINTKINNKEELSIDFDDMPF